MLRRVMYKLSKEESAALQQGHLICLRSEYAIIKASGATVTGYLQGQITQDMSRLTESQGIYSAILTPQGKTVSDLHIISGHNGELIMIARKDYAEALVSRLRQFSLGHELRVGIVGSLKLISIQGNRCDDFLHNLDLRSPAESSLSTGSTTDREAFTMRMPEAAESGVWVVTSDAEALLERSSHLVDESTIHAARILKGVPTYGVDWNEKVFPLNANLTEFDGVSFDKGCYVGQEVTSRMQWRGGIKKRLYRVQLESYPGALPCPLSTTVEIGMVTSAAMTGDGEVYGIAHLPIELVENRTPLIDPEGDSVSVIEACHV